jgi:N-6 DNA Methylase
VSATFALAGAREILSVAGYGDDVVDSNYPVWLGRDRGIGHADLVAFGRPAPKDMSTAVITVTSGTIEGAFDLAQMIGVPYFLLAEGEQLDLWVAEPARPRRWREAVTAADVPDLREWLRPPAALMAKIGLRQLHLFDIPVNLLATARSHSADELAPIVGDSLRAASDSLRVRAGGDLEQGRRLLHRSAARLVVGALTVLVMRDRDEGRRPSLDPTSLITRVVEEHPSMFGWFADSSPQERSVLEALVKQLGDGIDYRSLDPSILSEVYEQALVNDDDRRRLGIHYTPPALARRLLTDLPVETVAPEDRHVLDPSCGSGTLLIAAHDRLRDLQPSNWAEEERHRDLAVHLHGYDRDPFAREIARLTLLLHAQPAGNGWHIDELDIREQPSPRIAPNLIVTNPPWRYHADGRRIQTADEFLRWSMNALAPGGLLGILLPVSWLSAENSAETRQRLSDQFDVFEIWRLPEGTFATSRAASAVLLARKRDGLGGTGARVVRQVDRLTLGRFLAGEPATASYLHAGGYVPLEVTAPALTIRKATTELGELADILSGSQPVKGIADRGRGQPYLNHLEDVSSYGIVSEDQVWHVAFPEDFEKTWGATIVDKRKILASAARSSNSPWRFRVAIDTLGVAMRNSMRGIAPHDQGDDDFLYALLIIVGSGFASVHAAGFGGDRNISAKVLPSLPIPTSRATLRHLARLGRKATALAHEPHLLGAHLSVVEQLVWDAYGVDEADRKLASARFAGHRAPERALRYPEPPPLIPPGTSTFRRVGAVLGVTGADVRLWVNGITPDAGVTIPLPARMPGWLARIGATFDVTGVERVEDLGAGRFRFQPMAWRDIDFDKVDPVPILSR